MIGRKKGGKIGLKVIIKARPEEIADLVKELRGQQTEDDTIDYLIPRDTQLSHTEHLQQPSQSQ